LPELPNPAFSNLAIILPEKHLTENNKNPASKVAAKHLI